MVELTTTIEGIGVSCDCGETTYVFNRFKNDVISCENDDCSRQFSVSVDAVDDDTVNFGDMPA